MKSVFNLAIDFDRRLFADAVKAYTEKRCVVRLAKQTKPRSSNQNRYLHSMLCLFGIELGYTPAEAKIVVKRKYGDFAYTKGGEVFMRSTADLSTDEMAAFIDWFRNWSAMEHGIRLPSAQEYSKDYATIDEYIDNHSRYIGKQTGE